MSLLLRYRHVRPSGIIPFASASPVAGSGGKRSRPGRALVLQPHDAVVFGEDLHRHLPRALQLVRLSDPSASARVEIPFRAGRLSFVVGLMGFSAIISASWGDHPDLSVWLLEPDFSEPPPHVGLAYPHIDSVLRELP